MQNIDQLCALIDEVVRNAAGPPAEEIGPDTQLLVSGLLDSLTIMRIVAGIERSSGVVLPDEAVIAANFRDPRALWDAVERARIGAETSVRP